MDWQKNWTQMVVWNFQSPHKGQSARPGLGTHIRRPQLTLYPWLSKLCQGQQHYCPWLSTALYARFTGIGCCVLWEDEANLESSHQHSWRGLMSSWKEWVHRPLWDCIQQGLWSRDSESCIPSHWCHAIQSKCNFQEADETQHNHISPWRVSPSTTFTCSCSNGTARQAPWSTCN